MITLSVIIFLIYAELIFWAIRGIQKLPASSAASTPSGATKKISIVIPFRNEALRLSPLLESLKLLPDPASLEFLFMDDGSEDRSTWLVGCHHPQLKLHLREGLLHPQEDLESAALLYQLPKERCDDHE